jgi:predicted RNA-binding protein (virulence factor B family)
MIEIGHYNELEVSRHSEPGVYLIDEEGNEILLPNKYVTDEMQTGSSLKVFVYKDSEDRPVATTERPYAIIDEFAFLYVKDVNQVGAFLDWGLEKDLFVPFREQAQKMVSGKSYVVYIYFDLKTERVVASGKLSQFTKNDFIELEAGQEVDLMICNKTDIGVNVIINNMYEGLIFQNEIFQNIQTGDRTRGYIKSVREDDKIDVSLEKIGYDSIEPNSKHLLNQLKFKDGFIPLNDKSDPELIKSTLEMSKKTFKKAVGTLYKQKLIRLEDDGIHLI